MRISIVHPESFTVGPQYLKEDEPGGVCFFTGTTVDDRVRQMFLECYEEGRSLGRVTVADLRQWILDRAKSSVPNTEPEPAPAADPIVAPAPPSFGLTDQDIASISAQNPRELLEHPPRDDEWERKERR